jgi:hypothetical protein
VNESAKTRRLVKGTGAVDLVKMVRHVRKQRAFPPLRPESEALLNDRILPTEWYSHEAFLGLIQFAFEVLLGRSEQKAMEMGTAGGRIQLLGPHRAFVDEGDQLASAWAMRHMWRLNFNFGDLRAERDANGVRYALTGYEDVPLAHAYMIAGWARAGVQLAGPGECNIEILERPWQGGSTFTFRVSLPGA